MYNGMQKGKYSYLHIHVYLVNITIMNLRYKLLSEVLNLPIFTAHYTYKLKDFG